MIKLQAQDCSASDSSAPIPRKTSDFPPTSNSKSRSLSFALTRCHPSRRIAIALFVFLTSSRSQRPARISD